MKRISLDQSVDKGIFYIKNASGVAQFKKMSYICTVFQKQRKADGSKTDLDFVDMSITSKRRAVVSFENMSDELAAAFAEKYPKGYSDYFPDLVKYDKPDGTSFYAVTVEIPDAIYLVKIKVKTDDAEDLERWLDGEDGDDETNEGESLPDDNISQYSNGDDDGSDAE